MCQAARPWASRTMEAAPPTKRKRRSKWDVKAVDAPPAASTAAPAPAVSALEAAQNAVARAMPTTTGGALVGAAPILPNQKTELSPAPEATVGLCTCSASARRRLVARGTHDEITAKTGAAVTTKGRYFPPAEAERVGTEALHLHLTGDLQEQVDAAVKLVQTLMETQPPSTATQGHNHAPVAPSQAVSTGFSHFLAVGIQPEARCRFDVTAKLSGPQGSFLTHIGREARCAVSLRGGNSPNDPLGIFISHAPSHDSLRHAVGLVSTLQNHCLLFCTPWIPHLPLCAHIFSPRQLATGRKSSGNSESRILELGSHTATISGISRLCATDCPAAIADSSCRNLPWSQLCNLSVCCEKFAGASGVIIYGRRSSWAC